MPRTPSQPPGVRRSPSQRRSRLRVEAILDAAARLIGEKGIAAVTMQDIARAIGAPISALYQYFPNKSAIVATLFAKHTEAARADAAAAFDGCDDPAALIAALSDLLQRTYRRLKRDPALQDVVNAVLADKQLQHLDIEDSRWHAEAFAAAAAPLIPAERRKAFARSAFLVAHLVGGVMQLALTLDDAEAERLIDDYVRLARSALGDLLDEKPAARG